MMARYGPPDGVTPTRLIWSDSRPWRETILQKDEIPHNFPMPPTDILEQDVSYGVPPDKFGDLARYDGSVIGMKG